MSTSSIKLILRIAAVLTGTAYFCAAVYTIMSVFPILHGIQETFGYFFAGFAELFAGTILSGIGLGLWRVAR